MRGCLHVYHLESYMCFDGINGVCLFLYVLFDCHSHLRCVNASRYPHPLYLFSVLVKWWHWNHLSYWTRLLSSKNLHQPRARAQILHENDQQTRRDSRGEVGTEELRVNGLLPIIISV